ncbi:MAG: polyprenyl synthetase family protein [Oscillospiraceae bacterium]|nr:polyprenyl synthetase family protein [Oscillospiraceae bacterium]
MNPEFEKKLKYNAEIVNAVLEKYLDLKDIDYNILYESMRYSSLSGGKRIRAFLAIEFFSVFAGLNKINNPEIILPVAAAIEMIHTYSLIHDDLPCMDDDDFRRGLPSNHKKFGEATALLAGDALLTYAFNIISNAELLTDNKKVKIISEISKAAGHSGMIGGQMMDMLNENKNIDVIRLIKTHTLKTGNMIIVSARSGCIAGGANEEEIIKATEYAKNIGLAFQVIDDIFDNQNSFAEAFEYAEKLTAEAVLKLDELKKINKNINIDTGNLEFFAKYLLERKN